MLVTFCHSSFYLLCNIAHLGNSEPVRSNKLSTAWLDWRTEGRKRFPNKSCGSPELSSPGWWKCQVCEVVSSWGALWGKRWHEPCVTSALVTGLLLGFFIIQKQEHHRKPTWTPNKKWKSPYSGLYPILSVEGSIRLCKVSCFAVKCIYAHASITFI